VIRKIDKIDEKCAVTHTEIEITQVSEFSERKVNAAKLAGKERKSTKRKASGKRKRVKSSKFQRTIQDFWKWCRKHQKNLWRVIFCAVLGCCYPKLVEVVPADILVEIIKLVLRI
jgi:hypothetical protein